MRTHVVAPAVLLMLLLFTAVASVPAGPHEGKDPVLTKNSQEGVSARRPEGTKAAASSPADADPASRDKVRKTPERQTDAGMDWLLLMLLFLQDGKAQK